MSRYQVTSGKILYADFYDSGEAHRYARSLSKKLGEDVVRVRRVSVIKPALTTGDEGVCYSAGGRL